MASKADIRAETDRLLSGFVARGAEAVETDILMPAGALLDLYGEDIRARAYVTQDPLRGEMMLRPDFTLQVATGHLGSDRAHGTYAYAGQVFRRQEDDDERPREYVQVGYERFGDDDPVAAEVEVFCAVQEACAGAQAKPATGDIGFLIAAVEGLDTPDRRKAALMRHLWHPVRFKALLDRYARPGPPPPVWSGDVTHVGLRSVEEIETRIAALAAEERQAPITPAEAARIEAIFEVSGPLPSALARLREIAGEEAPLNRACDRLAARTEALDTAGMDPAHILFEASYGRTSMEYYDGFVFGFAVEGRPDLPAVATGGRYDALCANLGGAGVSAVGAVVRPELLLEAAT